MSKISEPYYGPPSGEPSGGCAVMIIILVVIIGVLYEIGKFLAFWKVALS